ncbi:hypothetical protein [Mycobacterium servetii]|uniref:PE-PGRS family protein n=1 Tax=Mycobacterium servetii TaxID=3237418 RepID=A0ABV4BXF4_9MYCO
MTITSTADRQGVAAWSPAGSSTRMRPYLAAGVAMMGASLIAVNPLTPTIVNDIQERAVRLTDSVVADVGDFAANVGTALPGSLDMSGLASAAASIPPAVNPIVEWLNVFETAGSNLQSIADTWLADPFPVLAQVASNQIGFADTLGSNLQTLGNGVYDLLTQTLPPQINTLIDGIQAGDIASSVSTFNSNLTLDLLPLATPLVNIADIPGEMLTNLSTTVSQNLSNTVLELLLDFNGTIFAQAQGAANGLQLALDAYNAGQYGTAFVDLLNVPALSVGGYLNGSTGPFDVGYLQTGGLLDQLVNEIPQAFAKSLIPSGGTAATWGGVLDQLGTLLFGGLESYFGVAPAAFDPVAAFDPAAFSAAFDPAALSMAFDPAAVTDIGSMLAADLAPNLSTIALDLLSSLL